MRLVILILFWWCLIPNVFSQSSAVENEIISAVIAQATDNNPRNSEGDIVVLQDGTLLVAWSDFYQGNRDDSPARISAAKSIDGGQTWGPRFTLQQNAGVQNVMSVSFLSSQSGDLLFFYLMKNSRRDLDVLMRRSLNEGKTWSDPVLVTPDPGYHVMNNARVVQLKSGRILCPISFTDEVWTKKEHFRNVIYYSDDIGKTWSRGEGTVNCPKRGAMEPGLVELKDGRVLQIIRTQMGQIWHAYSSDQGDTWTEAKSFSISSPEAPATIARIPGSKEMLLVYNPTVLTGVSHNGPRTPLVASLSLDEGSTWSKPGVIESDLNATYSYPSVTFHEDRVLLTYYVAPNGSHRLSLKVKSIPLTWFRK